MSQKSKTTRTRIADLPVTLSEVPAEELAQVDGGMANTGAALHGGLVLRERHQCRLLHWWRC